MGEIQVSLEALQAGQAGVQRSFNALDSTLTELENSLRPMIETWSGAAQESYLQCKRQWDEAALALAQVLQTVARAVGDAHENYQSTHLATEQIWA